MGMHYVDYSRYAACGATTAGATWGEACAAVSGVAPASDWEDRRAAAGPWATAEHGAAEPAASERVGRGATAGHSGALAAFWLLYESRDQRLSLFETRDGHLAAVDPARLV